MCSFFLFRGRRFITYPFFLCSLSFFVFLTRCGSGAGPCLNKRAMSGLPAHNLTDEELAEFREIFNLVDRDGGGTITKEELGELMDTLGIDATPEEIDLMINEIDQDSNGEIDFEGEGICGLLKPLMCTVVVVALGPLSGGIELFYSPPSLTLDSNTPPPRCSFSLGLSSCSYRIRRGDVPKSERHLHLGSGEKRLQDIRGWGAVRAH